MRFRDLFKKKPTVKTRHRPETHVDYVKSLYSKVLDEGQTPNDSQVWAGAVMCAEQGPRAFRIWLYEKYGRDAEGLKQRPQRWP